MFSSKVISIGWLEVFMLLDKSKRVSRYLFSHLSSILRATWRLNMVEIELIWEFYIWSLRKWTWPFQLPRSKIPVTRSRRNLQERDGKNAGSCRNTPEVTGSWKQYSGRKIPDFFGDFRPVSGGKAQESDRNAPEKIQKFSGRNTASMIRWLPVYSYRNCPVLFDLGRYQLPGNVTVTSVP